MVLIWDKDGAPPCNADGPIYLWNSFNEDGKQNIHSIPRHIEDHAKELRDKYLAYIHQLGEKKHKGIRVVEHLEIRPEFSYWWMTLISEKCNYSKSKWINDALKLLALESVIDHHEVKQIQLVTKNIDLSYVLREWCDRRGVCFEYTNLPQQKPLKLSIKGLYKLVPRRIQAIVWLFHKMVVCLPLVGAGVDSWKKSNATISFISYFFNLEPEAAKQGNFESHYWGNLPNIIATARKETRWLHIWVKDKAVPSAKAARKLIEHLNCKTENGQLHVTLDSFLTVRVIWNTLVDWLRLQWKARNLECVLDDTKKSAINLWPLMQNDWKESIKGSTAMSNLLMLNLFETAFVDIPKQKQGVYLQENQGWEFGCISAWNNADHNQLIGFSHSTVRYWDLRYYFDSRSYHHQGHSRLPLPSRVAVNGSVAKDSYLQAGFPSEKLVEVESIRYLYLEDGNIQSLSSTNNLDKQRLLVLGEYLQENTALQMSMLEKIADDLSAWEIVIKSHPACQIDLSDYPGLTSINASLTDQPLSELLPVFNVAYTSQVTSAAVDAYCSGLAVISVLDPSMLNMSPLLGVDGVRFSCSSEELIEALRDIGLQEDPKQFFYLDNDFPRWKKLLGIVE